MVPHCSNKPSFLILPPELRHHVYEYILDDASRKVVSNLMAGKNSKWHEQRRKAKARRQGLETLPSALFLILTCKQIRAETELMVHGKIPFIVEAIPLVRPARRHGDRKIAANMIYRQALLKTLTEGQCGIAPEKLHLVQQLEFCRAWDFLHFLNFERELDELYGCGEYREHNVVGELFRGVKTVVVWTDRDKTVIPLKFGLQESDWEENRPWRMRCTFPLLEEVVVFGSDWVERIRIAAET